MGLFDIFKKKADEKDALGNMTGNDYTQSGDGAYFRMVIEDIFYITGRGTIVTGVIESGSIKIGDEVIVETQGGTTIKTVITGVESYRQMKNEAHTGENVGLLLAQVQKSQVKSGDIIIKMWFLKMVRKS